MDGRQARIVGLGIGTVYICLLLAAIGSAWSLHDACTDRHRILCLPVRCTAHVEQSRVRGQPRFQHESRSQCVQNAVTSSAFHRPRFMALGWHWRRTQLSRFGRRAGLGSCIGVL